MEKRPIKAPVVVGAILIVLGAMMLLERVLPWAGNLVWAAIFALGGLALLGVYNRSKPRRWPLILAYIAFALAGLMLIEMVPLLSNLEDAYVMFAIAIPFLYVYLRDRKLWALIPGGIMAAIGVGLLLENTIWLFPIVLIVVGLYLMIRQFGKSGGKVESTPASGPEADRAQE
jgi:hypothetical protein